MRLVLRTFFEIKAFQWCEKGSGGGQEGLLHEGSA